LQEINLFGEEVSSNQFNKSPLQTFSAKRFTFGKARSRKLISRKISHNYLCLYRNFYFLHIFHGMSEKEHATSNGGLRLPKMDIT
jgi:hypothetical protein